MDATAIYARTEGVGLSQVRSGKAAVAEEDADYSRDAVLLRQGFRDLSPSNKRLTLEFVRMLARLQKGT